jgi:hypothetical protein
LASHDAIAQAPFAHAGTPNGAVHTTLHPPQLFTSSRIVTSHPLPGSPSQSAVPEATHEEQPHTPAEHFGGQLVEGHSTPHPPQWFTFVLVFTSHPLTTTPSQSS